MRARVEYVSMQPPSAEAMEKARRAVERAVASLWNGTSGLSIWRTFYACLAAQMDIGVEWNPLVRIHLPDGRVLETGRGGWTDGRRIVINAATLGDENEKETLKFVVHELEHVARMHTLRMGERDPWLWNVATDLVINRQIAKEFPNIARDELNVPIDISDKDAEEDVYRKLCGLKFLPREYQGDLVPLKEAEASRRQVVEAVRLAALRSEQDTPGSVPGDVMELLHLANRKAPEWARVVRRWMKEMSGEQRTWTRLHRRSASLAYAAPGKRKRLEKAGLVIDTSGSMTLWHLEAVLAEVRAMARELGLGLIVWQVDAAVYGPLVYEQPEEMPDDFVIVGRGGTFMQPAVDEVAKHRPPLTLWVTDGAWCDAPRLPGGRHIAILTGRRCRAPLGVEFDDVVCTQPSFRRRRELYVEPLP